jgi:hypothetical protein
VSAELATSDAFAVTKTPQGSWVPGTPSWTKIESSKSKAGGHKLLLQTLTWTMSGCTLPAYTFVSGGGSIAATASKMKAENMPPCRKGDFGMCSGMFTLTASPFTPMPCSCRFEITDAGQVKAKGM